MDQENQRPWERMIRDLYRGFSVLDQEITLLRDIDQTILDIGRSSNSASLEDLFLDTADRFSRIHRLDSPMLCYVYLGSHLSVLHKPGMEPPHPVRIPLPGGFNPFLNQADDDPVLPLLLTSEGRHQIFDYFAGTRSILLRPMYLPTGQVLCVFVLSDHQAPQGSDFTDRDFKRSVAAVVRQLAIAHGHRARALEHERMQGLWGAFLAEGLSPTKCFEHLAKRVPDFLPSFGPLKFPGDSPDVQLLMLRGPDDTGMQQHLVIRGTTGAEPDGTRVAIDRSICGLLVEKPQLPFFCDDPSKPKYEGRYRSYLGQGRTIKTELAVRVMDGSDFVGILNLESELPDAFNIHHVDAIRALAKTVGPIVTVLEHRLAMNTSMQMSVSSSMARYLEGLASVFRHGVGTPLLSLRANTDFITDIVAADLKRALDEAGSVATTGPPAKLTSALNEASAKVREAEAAIGRLREVHEQIAAYTKDFAADIGSYGELGPMNLRAIIDATIKLVNDSLLAKLGGNIRIEIERDETTATTRVFCSTLLKQHLYSVFHNAIVSIQDRREADPSPGLISISVTRKVPPESQEAVLNASWALRIRDNGKGVSREQLEQLRRFQPGTRFRGSAGQGRGLTAVQRFVVSIGGRIDLDSEVGTFFEVTLQIDDYRPAFHAALPVAGI